jgi:hypothetical protein
MSLGEQDADDLASQPPQRRTETGAATRLTLGTTESTDRRCVRPWPHDISGPTHRHCHDRTIVRNKRGPPTPVDQMVSDALVEVFSDD